MNGSQRWVVGGLKRGVSESEIGHYVAATLAFDWLNKVNSAITKLGLLVFSRPIKIQALFFHCPGEN